MTGSQQMNGPNGPVEMTIESSGPISMKFESTINQSGAGGAAVAPIAGNAPPPAAAGGGNDVASFAGTFQDEQMKLELVPEQAGSYSGSITMGDQKYPVKAAAHGNQLVGTFDSGGQSFDFTASLDSGNLKFTTGSTDYNLKKVGERRIR